MMFLTFSVLVANPRELLFYTVGNPVIPLVVCWTGKREQKEQVIVIVIVWQRNPPHAGRAEVARTCCKM